MKTLLFSVTAENVLWEFFAVGGNGGAGKDTSNTGVRVTHAESGAIGRATESRSQMANRRLAFKRMADSFEFQQWAKAEGRRLMDRKKREADIDERVEASMQRGNLIIEGKSEGGAWLRIESSE